MLIVKKKIDEIISIHSLRMEGDRGCGTSISGFRNISIHSLRMEGDQAETEVLQPFAHFNPLPPHGGRQTPKLSANACAEHFNPLPPHGGRLLLGIEQISAYHISIHSLRMEGDW